MTPILRANGGVEMFNTTPNGNNHAKTLWDYAGQRNDWFRLSLDANHTGVVTKEALDEIRAEYIAQGNGLDKFEQEYMNSWDAAIKAAHPAWQQAAIQAAEAKRAAGQRSGGMEERVRSDLAPEAGLS